MADASEPQSNHRQNDRPPSQIYNQHHDSEQDIFWPEPVDPAVGSEPPALFEPQPHTTPLPEPESRPRPPRKNVIKRRPVKPIISDSPPSEKPDEQGLLSPIIPSPLRIRKSKPASPLPPPASMRSVRLLIASLGNPPPYHSTRHSAGHIVLKNLASHLGFPALSKSKLLGSGLVSSGEDVGRSEYTLWQSGSLMNISGQGTLKAWKLFNNQYPASHDMLTALVLLHDELESQSGTIKLRSSESSPKGHNGIKSVHSSLKSAGLLSALGDRFIKIGIGIGRPQSREKDDVSAWVLGQLTQGEKSKLEAATESVAAVIASEVAKLERS